jgi:hypothetical protein
VQILILQQLVDSVHSQHPEQKIIFKIKKKNISVQILILQQLVDSVHSQHPEQKIIFKIKKKKHQCADPHSAT